MVTILRPAPLPPVKAMLIIPVVIMIETKVNQRASVTHTIACVILTYLFARFARSIGKHGRSPAATPPGIMHALSCVLFAALLTALGRRVWWLRNHMHDSWPGRRP